MKTTGSRATTKVIVVGGGGTIGSSTALHLIRSGYTPSNITVLDVYPFPSAQSAGNDLNKIMGIRVSSKIETRLSLEAADMWTDDELFKPFFHKTGRVSQGRLRQVPKTRTDGLVTYRWIARCQKQPWLPFVSSMRPWSTLV